MFYKKSILFQLYLIISIKNYHDKLIICKPALPNLKDKSYLPYINSINNIAVRIIYIPDDLFPQKKSRSSFYSLKTLFCCLLCNNVKSLWDGRINFKHSKYPACRTVRHISSCLPSLNRLCGNTHESGK